MWRDYIGMDNAVDLNHPKVKKYRSYVVRCYCCQILAICQILLFGSWIIYDDLHIPTVTFLKWLVICWYIRELIDHYYYIRKYNRRIFCLINNITGSRKM